MSKKAKKIADFNEEKQSRAGANQGGMSQTKLERYAGSYETIKAKMDQLRGDLGAEVKSFEEDGGNKAAFKLALKLKSMESAKAQDFWRSLETYMDMLGIFDQHDLFDPVPGQAAMSDAPDAPAFKEAAE